MQKADAVSRLSVGFLLLLLLGQPAQWYAIAHHREPYPTLTFPVFDGPGQRRSAEPVLSTPTFTAHWESAQSTDVPTSELFVDVPLPTRWTVIVRNFGPRHLEESDTRTSVSTDWLAGRQQFRRRSSNPALAREAAAWLRGRLGTMYGGRRAVAVTIQWSSVQGGKTKNLQSTRIELDESDDGR